MSRRNVGVKRIRVGFEQSLVRKVQYFRGPYCHKCRKYVIEDEECGGGVELVDNLFGVTKRFATVRAKHHGEESIVQIDMGTEHWDHADLEKAMRSQRWFAPDEEAVL